MGHGRSNDPAAQRALALSALGVVYGDIGTSPLYSMYECFRSAHGVEATRDNVLGVLSLIVWALIILITVKYVTFVTRADNEGEGGILALMALVRPRDGSAEQRYSYGWWLVALGLFGASLLYGEGVITPAISVLSAVEGLNYVSDGVTPFIIPVTIALLVGLFAVQSKGTAKMGAFFGPVMLLWFGTLGAIGLYNLVQHPDVLTAVNPWYGAKFLLHGGWHGYFVLGSVFLVCTGGEALYADMGHFGRQPIQRAWLFVVLPGLLLNYFGQGALLIYNPETPHPFFGLVPEVARVPLVLLATASTVIASQALISGAYSLTRNAVQLGFFPRIEIKHTSAEEIGQIYIGPVNWALLAAAIALVIGFRSSTNLAAAYGIAVVCVMMMTTILSFNLAIRVWEWPLWKAVPLFGTFLVVELAFFGANLPKIKDGGWFPLLLGAAVFTCLSTWQRGRKILTERIRQLSVSLEDFRRVVDEDKPTRVHRTGIFMTGNAQLVPPALLRNLFHNRVIHDRVILLTVLSEEVPYVDAARRIEVMDLGHGFWRVLLRYGFMENPDVPRDMTRTAALGLDLDLDSTTYFLGKETIIASEFPGMSLWREQLFAFLARNAQPATAFYKIPAWQVIEIGAQIEI